ncbi:MAG: rRNA pseudouridine synthase [bacterium]|nr:rRNA pseudouridine synthase [bacterium]
MADERLQKIIARAGLCSRRDADQRIADGRVTVNGSVVKPGAMADASHDHIKVDGKMLKAPETRRYLLFYKPREVVTTCDDPEERTTVIDMVRSRIRQRVFPVGRLDYHSEGLLILTNDGDMAAKVLHPRNGVEREYLAKVKGDLNKAEVQRLLKGAVIEGRRVTPIRVIRKGPASAANTWWLIAVGEGRTHEVRELFFRIGHRVQRLKRVAIGPINDSTLRPGDLRDLTEAEIKALQAVGPQPRRTKPRQVQGASRRSKTPTKSRKTTRS